MKHPFISVIIPAHNEAKFVSSTLTSVFSQSLPRDQYEVIVVDNASTDQTSTIARKFPVRLVKEPRQSVVLARQKGADVSRGRIIVSADADTIYPPDWLMSISKNFILHPDLIALVGWINFSGTSPVFNTVQTTNQKLNLLLSRHTHRLPLVFAANFAFTKKSLTQIGGYPTHLPELGDQQYLLHRFGQLGRILVDPAVTCTTSARRHQGQLIHIFTHNFYRLASYSINRLAGKQLLGPADPIR